MRELCQLCGESNIDKCLECPRIAELRGDEPKPIREILIQVWHRLIEPDEAYAKLKGEKDERFL